MPDKVTFCGLVVVSESLTDNVALTATPEGSTNRGRKRTVMVQLAPAFKVPPQVDCAPAIVKSTDPAVERVMFVNGPVPWFDNVNE